jgi:hypothetical protein
LGEKISSIHEKIRIIAMQSKEDMIAATEEVKFINGNSN